MFAFASASRREAFRREAFRRKRTLENATAKINMQFYSTNAQETGDRLGF
ncbi:MAG: hypothetical protein F6K48_20050 [Okeania sp. SIO3H1]|nr:hypothetical protein [Okeania sp. SIO3H1]